MGLKRYIFKSGLDIVAPLKCGTRWLEGLDVENRIDAFGIHITDLPQHIHSGTTFIWRPVMEHFISAVQTEWAMAPDRDIWDIITEIERGECGHWNPTLYERLYPLWEKTRFRFHKLRALSEITPSASELRYNTKMYEFRLQNELDSIQSALSSLSPKHTIRINRFVGDEENRLKSMLKEQYIGYSWEDYSELEDSLFSARCKVRSLESDIEEIYNLKIVKDLQLKLMESNKLNLILQSKLDYNEMVMGKAPTKLI